MSKLYKWVLLFLLLFCAVSFIFAGYPYVKQWRMLELVKSARSEGRLLDAYRYLVRAEAIKPGALATTIEMANLMLQMQSPYAKIWLAKWCETAPEDPHPRIQLAKLLLAGGDLDQAKFLRDHIHALGTEDQFGFLELEVGILVEEKRPAEAIRLFQDFLPEAGEDRNQVLLNMAAIQIAMDSELSRQNAVQILYDLKDDPEVGNQATTHLIFYYRSLGELEKAEEISSQLLERVPAAYYHARLLYQIRRELGKLMGRDLQDLFLAQINRQPYRLPEMAHFLIGEQGQEDLKQLLSRLPEELTQSPLGFYAHTILLHDEDKWSEIAELLVNQDWGHLSYLRLLYLIEARSRLSLSQGSKALLSLLGQELAGSSDRLLIADELMRRWGWRKPRITIWQRLSKSTTVPEMLIRSVLQQPSLHQDIVTRYCYTFHLLSHMPDNPVVIHNHVLYGLLLNHEVARLLPMAEKNIEDVEDQAAARSVYALALLQNGKLSEALSAVDQLADAGSISVQIRFYMELIRLANGLSLAGSWNPLVEDQLILLPEEIVLWEKWQAVNATASE